MKSFFLLAGIDRQSFVFELVKYGGLKAEIEKLTKELDRLRKEVDLLRNCKRKSLYDGSV
jgi:hypothetical protein